MKKKKKYSYIKIEFKELDVLFQEDDINFADGVLLKAYALIPGDDNNGGDTGGSPGNCDSTDIC